MSCRARSPTSTSSRPRFTKAYSFGLVTGLFFLLSWAAQFILQMMEVRNEAQQHGQQFTWSDFSPQFFQSTFENWQSEFLPLIWQAAGLAFVLLLGLVPVQGGRRPARGEGRRPAARARDRPGGAERQGRGVRGQLTFQRQR